ncbi:hypothetical protein [Ferrovibrio terrae]|uniref:hypothetical protein n=1 Tax=Ferrovibrio terrae TaxID=2594003 RepID=UPI00313772CC
MDGLVAALGAIIALLLFGLAAVIVIDRARNGYRRAEAEQTGRRNRQHELTMRLEQLERAVAEQRPAIAEVRRKVQQTKADCESLKAQLNATEHVFSYTAVPMESRDMHARPWRFSARHPTLGADLPDTVPAGQWNQGRPYVLTAENQAEARSVMDRLLPRHRGFMVVNMGEASSDAPAQPSPG